MHILGNINCRLGFFFSINSKWHAPSDKYFPGIYFLNTINLGSNRKNLSFPHLLKRKKEREIQIFSRLCNSQSAVNKLLIFFRIEYSPFFVLLEIPSYKSCLLCVLVSFRSVGYKKDKIWH